MAELGKFLAKSMLLVLNASQLVCFSNMRYSRELDQHNNKIIECVWDAKTGTWHMMRVRTDKSHPNSLSVANSIVAAIANPITESYLLDYIDRKGYHEKSNNVMRQHVDRPEIAKKASEHMHAVKTSNQANR